MRLSAIRERADDAVLRGMACMLLSGLASVSMNAVIRQLSESQHPFEIALFRNLFGFLVLLPLIWHRGAFATFRTRRLGLHLLRGLFNAMGMLTFFLALSLAPLAEVQALTFTAPLFTMLGAAVLLKEKVGPRRWTAMGIGLLGTLLILRPGVEAVSLGGLLTLFAALGWSSAMLVIKVMTRSESSLTITAYAAVFIALLSLPAALPFWATPTLGELLLLGLIGLLGSTAQLALAQAFHYADTSSVLPVDFTKLIWASLAGFLLFGEVPSTLALLGGSVVFLSVVYVARREAAAAQAALRTSGSTR